MYKKVELKNGFVGMEQEVAKEEKEILQGTFSYKTLSVKTVSPVSRVVLVFAEIVQVISYNFSIDSLKPIISPH